MRVRAALPVVSERMWMVSAISMQRLRRGTHGRFKTGNQKCHLQICAGGLQLASQFLFEKIHPKAVNSLSLSQQVCTGASSGQVRVMNSSNVQYLHLVCTFLSEVTGASVVG